MTETEVKKYLLKQNPEAAFAFIRQGHAYYSTVVQKADNSWKTVNFKIPVDDMGSTDFLNKMPGQSLNRWIYLPEN